MRRAEAIRKLFLERREQYSLHEAAELLGWNCRDLAEEIGASELRRVEVDSQVSWQAVATLGMTTWSYESIEEALGGDTRLLPRLARLADRTFRLPHYQFIAIEAAARKRGETVNEFLAGYLLDLVCTESPALTRDVPGFREAFIWPQPVGRQAETAA